jgi:dihydropteroate synthase
MHLLCAGRVLELDRPAVMGVLNVTPDSFSDGGRYLDPDAALARAERMAAEGAAIIDIGGESTRPGAAAVAGDEELRRVLPVLERVAARLPVLLSVDTSNPEVIRRACAAGAHLMHMQGEPASMQADPRYDDVVEEVKTFLAERVQTCIAAGIARERLCIDPGFGFGKLLAHNLQLLRDLAQFERLGLPLAVGLSRKSMVTALGARSHERLAGSLALATIAVLQGAQIVRAHDVAATVDAVRVADAVRRRSSGG